MFGVSVSVGVYLSYPDVLIVTSPATAGGAGGAAGGGGGGGRAGSGLWWCRAGRRSSWCTLLRWAASDRDDGKVRPHSTHSDRAVEEERRSGHTLPHSSGSRGGVKDKRSFRSSQMTLFFNIKSMTEYGRK